MAGYYGLLQIPWSEAPTVIAVPIGTGKNNPTTANSADGEVMLDIEVAGFGQFNGLARQHFGVALKEALNGKRGSVAGARRPTRSNTPGKSP
jgi:hypothetical protein